jgi:hypothetical protein
MADDNESVGPKYGIGHAIVDGEFFCPPEPPYPVIPLLEDLILLELSERGGGNTQWWECACCGLRQKTSSQSSAGHAPGWWRTSPCRLGSSEPTDIHSVSRPRIGWDRYFPPSLHGRGETRILQGIAGHPACGPLFMSESSHVVRASGEAGGYSATVCGQESARG